MVATDPGEGAATTGRYRFDDIVVDAAAHTLSRAGELQAVEPKSFAVLLALLQRPGELIGRDDLLDRVWGHRHVTPGVLTRAIAQLRHALDDDSQRPKYIQTQHAVGYRFVGTLLDDWRSDPQRDVGQYLAKSLVEERPTLSETAPNATEIHERASSNKLIAAGGERINRALIFGTVLVVVMLSVWLLWRRAAEPVHGNASVAVLPFATLSGERRDRYFAEGLAVEMHSALAAVPGLKVASWATAEPGRVEDPRIVGKLLGVAAVLGASVRRDGSRIRIDAHLSDTATGLTTWNRTYDREVSDVFATQHEIASEVVHALVGKEPAVDAALRKRLAPTQNLMAFDAYLRGLQQLLSEEGDPEQAVGHFRRALAGDRGFARAQAGLCRAELRRFEAFRNADAFANAREACVRAQRMDGTLAEVRFALAELYRLQGDLTRAAAYFRMLERDPVYRMSALIGLANVAAAAGRESEALARLRDALRENPHSSQVMAEYGFLHYEAGRLQEAIAWYRKAVDAQPDDAGMWSTYGALLLVAGNTDAATKALERSISIEPSEVPLSNLGTLRYQACDYAGAAAMYRRAIEINPGDFMFWGNLGDALYADAATKLEAANVFREAVARGQRYIEIKSDDARALAALGAYRASLGQASAAHALALRAESLGTERAEVGIYNAVTFALLGDQEAARARITAARAAGMDETRIATHAVLWQNRLSTPGTPAGRGGAHAPCTSGPAAGE